MYKKVSLILAALVAVTALPNTAFGFQNPLKSYDLYADTHRPTTATPSSDRETVMGEYYSNSLRPPGHGSSEAAMVGSEKTRDNTVYDSNGVKRRNQVLRESALKIYANPSTEPGWTQGPSFYKNPSLESIKTKYKKSNFAGCLQESISYVRMHPTDTLGFYYLAMSYAKVNDKDNAIKAYERVIALNDNPMIVKYATNGRNCVMGNSSEACYPDVNVPELIYPYADIAAGKTVEEMTLIDPQTLVNRNMDTLYNQMSQVAGGKNTNGKEGDKKNIDLPFYNQDESLDQFIRAPYGTGLSPELEKEYKQLQLRKLQQNMNSQDGSVNSMGEAHSFDQTNSNN